MAYGTITTGKGEQTLIDFKAHAYTLQRTRIF